jgi:sulfite oxidase
VAGPTPRPGLIVYQRDPFNAGAPLDRPRLAFLTPAELFFVRAHGSVPEVDRDSYRLVVGGMVRRPLELDLRDLLTRFAQHSLTATVMCAGNRRGELAALRPLPGELPWGADAISTARWRGVRLSDVLHAAGVGVGARHVAFCGLDEARVDGSRVHFGASIPLEKALAPEVLLVHEMNDAPLPREHGFPLRVLVAGYVGARSVKWLREITLRGEPSTNYFEARDYKTFPPDVTAETVDWSRGKTLNEIELNSVICTPHDGEVRAAGSVLVEGYAVTGAEVPVQRVEISVDHGATWIPATLKEPRARWSWCLWEAELDLRRGDCEIAVRAWDAAGRTQPEEARPLWNFKGYANNAWHRVRVRLS